MKKFIALTLLLSLGINIGAKPTKKSPAKQNTQQLEQIDIPQVISETFDTLKQALEAQPDVEKRKDILVIVPLDELLMPNAELMEEIMGELQGLKDKENITQETLLELNEKYQDRIIESMEIIDDRLPEYYAELREMGVTVIGASMSLGETSDIIQGKLQDANVDFSNNNFCAKRIEIKEKEQVWMSYKDGIIYTMPGKLIKALTTITKHTKYNPELIIFYSPINITPIEGLKGLKELAKQMAQQK